MPLASVTRLRLRSWRYLPPFAWYVWRVVRQAKGSAGLRAGALAYDSEGGLWTFTVWEHGGAMKAFRDTSPHLDVMPRLVGWCSEASFAHWEKEATDLPDASEARDRLATDGSLSEVRHPSHAHAAGETAPPDEAPRIVRRFGP